MRCLLGRNGPQEFRAIAPRHGLLRRGSEQKRAGAGGSQWNQWKSSGSGWEAMEVDGRQWKSMEDKEGVGRGSGGSGEVREVRRRSGRPWESAEEAGSNSTYVTGHFILVVALEDGQLWIYDSMKCR